MTSKESSTTAGEQARETTEKVVGAWKEGLQKLADQANMMPTMPPVDLNQSVEQYFQFVQRTVDLNRDLATSWAELVNTLTGATREQAESFSRIVKNQADTLAGLAAQQAENTRQVARAQAGQAGQVGKEQARDVRQAERERVNQDRAKARKAYEGLTKAELGDRLAERGLPKTGNVDDLIDRLVEADNK